MTPGPAVLDPADRPWVLPTAAGITFAGPPGGGGSALLDCALMYGLLCAACRSALFSFFSSSNIVFVVPVDALSTAPLLSSADEDDDQPLSTAPSPAPTTFGLQHVFDSSPPLDRHHSRDRSDPLPVHPRPPPPPSCNPISSMSMVVSSMTHDMLSPLPFGLRSAAGVAAWLRVLLVWLFTVLFVISPSNRLSSQQVVDPAPRKVDLFPRESTLTG
mmetsp:Transcript_3298/g.7760  ORF Transcript_3298/g.7760 Transcript_3298/m.7760 type:complete len:216 (+) Transcript_3298:488-1135(+)